MKKQSTCPCCGHTITLYKHHLNKQLVDALVDLAIHVSKTKKGANLQKDLSLTKNQYNNFQKLQYFGLVIRINTGWMITRRGGEFINGNCSVYNSCATFGKQVMNDWDPIWEGDNRRKIVQIWEILGGERKNREEYQKEKGLKFSLFDFE